MIELTDKYSGEAVFVNPSFIVAMRDMAGTGKGAMLTLNRGSDHWNLHVAQRCIQVLREIPYKG